MELGLAHWRTVPSSAWSVNPSLAMQHHQKGGCLKIQSQFARSVASIAVLTLAIISAAPAGAACVNLLTAPSNQTARSSWNELLTLKPSKSLNSVITSIQDIDADGVGDVNLD